MDDLSRALVFGRSREWLPVSADLFALLPGGGRNAWRHARKLARYPTAGALPSVGEDAILKRLRAIHGRVSIERLLSGPGLFDIYQAMGGIEGVQTPLADEKAVFAAGDAGEPFAASVLDRFCGILGSVAGDLALSYGARGGVYVSGGIAPRLADRLASGAFRARFEDKGRLSDYVSEIPTYLISHPYAALVGAARELKQMEGANL